MSEIILTENDGLEWAIKAFRRKVQRAGILKDFRKKRHYTKPSAAKRAKTNAAMRRKKRGRRRER